MAADAGASGGAELGVNAGAGTCTDGSDADLCNEYGNVLALLRMYNMIVAVIVIVSTALVVISHAIDLGRMSKHLGLCVIDLCLAVFRITIQESKRFDALPG